MIYATGRMASRNPTSDRGATASLWFLGPLLVAIALGILAGIGGYTFVYARGLSYFSRSPQACVNCHIMQSQFDGWQKASHHTSAVCVDCHLPKAFVAKYLAKAENGYRHGKLFTTGDFEEPIEVKPAGLEILQDNCVRCHRGMTDDMRAGGALGAHGDNDSGENCLHCHSTVGHGPRAGLGGPLSATERSQGEHQASADAASTSSKASKGAL